MNKKIILFLVLLLLFSALPINAGEKETGVVCFFDGNDYLALEEDRKLHSVVSIHDMFAYFLYVDHPEKYVCFELKTDGINAKQFMAIFDKYLEEHPEKWHHAFASLFVEAMEKLLNE